MSNTHYDEDAILAINIIKKDIELEKQLGPFSYKDISNFCDLYLLIYFGLSQKERNEFQSIMYSCYQPANLSNFPDFIFDNGLIEHFHITSTKETRKGSIQLKKYSEAESWYNSQHCNNIYSDVNYKQDYDVISEKNTHAYLINSCKRNWEKHIRRLREYKGSKEIVIFLLDYPDKNLKEFLSNSYFSKEKLKNNPWYVLSKDKLLLDYVYQFKNDVDYIIFLNGHYSEVIKTSFIPKIINSIPDNIEFVELQTITTYQIQLVQGK